MADFPLIQVLPELLKRIISKFEIKSYFRLQQTCRAMEELVQTSRIIEIFWKSSVSLFWEKEESGSLFPRALLNYRFVDIRCLYGIKFNRLEPAINTIDFDYKFGILKKHRITCGHLDTNRLSKEFNKNKCVALFKALKPVAVGLDSTRSNRFEAILELKRLEEASITTEFNVLYDGDLFVIKQFFGKEPHILHFSMNHIISKDQLFDLFIRILQFLRSEPHPNLKVMRVSGYFQGTDVSVEDLLALFNEFNPIPVEDRLRCSLGLNGHSVEIKIEPNYFKRYSCAMMSYLEEAIDNIIL